MKGPKDRALLIAFEGTDGAGKSTIARATYDRVSKTNNALRFIDKNRPPP